MSWDLLALKSQLIKMDQFIVEVSSEEDAKIIKGIIRQFKSARFKTVSHPIKMSSRVSLPAFNNIQLQREIEMARKQAHTGQTTSLDAFMNLRQQWLKELKRSGKLS